MTQEIHGVFGEERRNAILDLVTSRGRVRIGDLARELGVTEPTVRKDLARLERARKLQRTHGGAIAAQSFPERSFDEKRSAHAEAKTAIAQACLDLVGVGDAVYLDSGTTVLRIAELLNVPQVNVVTNGLAAAMAVGDAPSIRHTLLGGQARPAGGSVSGPLAVQNLQQFTVDTAFLGVTGVTEAGITVADFAEAQLKAAVIERARRVVVPLDASKVGVTDFASVAPLDRIDTIVTLDASEQLVHLCSRASIELIDARVRHATPDDHAD